MSLPEKHLPNLGHLKTLITQTRLNVNESVLALIEAVQKELENYEPVIQRYSSTVKTADWQSGDTGFFAEIANEAVSENDLAIVLLDDQSKAAATSAGLSNTCQTQAGKIRLQAASAPGADLSFQYWIDKGKGAM